jgi:hypothetical protein
LKQAPFSPHPHNNFSRLPAPRAINYGTLHRGLPAAPATAMSASLQTEGWPMKFAPQHANGRCGNNQQRYHLLPVHGWKITRIWRGATTDLGRLSHVSGPAMALLSLRGTRSHIAVLTYCSELGKLGGMRQSPQWIKRFKTHLKRCGFVIRDMSPEASAAAKRRARRADRSRIARGLVTPSQVQATNSLFPKASARGRVLGFKFGRKAV